MMDSSKKTNHSREESQHKKSVSLNVGLDTTFFRNDRRMSYLHKRSEKIAAAIYLVTKDFSDAEPAKFKIRNLATDTVSKVGKIHTYETNAVELLKSIELVFSEISSHLEISFVAGMMSEMNARIIQQEISNLVVEIRDYFVYRRNISFNDARLAIPKELTQTDNFTSSAEQEIDKYRKNFQGRTGGKDDFIVKDKIIKDKNNLHTEREDSIIKDENQQESLRKFSPVAVKRSKRRSVIINLLKKRKEVMIKDIVPLIDDCSEKTLQRELGALVDENVLKKRGDRRWTRYSLVRV